jgi:hypothetical protein
MKMKYTSLVIAAALALTGMAFAADQNSAAGDAETDKKVECVADFIASELDEDQKDKYLADCMQGTADQSLGGE